MNDIVKQLKKRRLELDFKQKDMKLRIGLSCQQYQHLEWKENPRYIGTNEGLSSHR